MADTKIKDGGPAFPKQRLKHWSEFGDSHHQAQPEYYAVSDGGMSLRDYFAAKAMQSLNADVHGVSYHVRHGQPDEARDHADFIAQAAYVMADAMLKARG